MDKASLGLRALRGDPDGKQCEREAQLLRWCNTVMGGLILDAFPGAQPTSITRNKVEEQLLRQAYLVCEKTDGERHLLLSYHGKVFLLDRALRVWTFPVQLPLPLGHPRGVGWHHNTLLDGELVLDTAPAGLATAEGDGTPGESAPTNGTAAASAGAATAASDAAKPAKVLRYLVYDAVMINGEDISHRPLTYRLRRAITDVALPLEQLQSHVDGAETKAQLMVKDFFEVLNLRDVITLAEHLPHKTDGLIFTPVMVPYAVGTCPSLLKWKPSVKNTVDFQIDVIAGQGRFLHVKLLVGVRAKDGWDVQHAGDWLAKTGSFFRSLQADPKAFQGQIVECKWHKNAKTFKPSNTERFTLDGSWEDGGWVIVDVRKDKKVPNDMRTSRRIVESIQDGLDVDALHDLVASAHRDGKLRLASDCAEDVELPRVDNSLGRRIAWLSKKTAPADTAGAVYGGRGACKKGRKGGRKGHGRGRGESDGSSGDGGGGCTFEGKEGATSQNADPAQAHRGKRGGRGRGKGMGRAKASSDGSGDFGGGGSVPKGKQGEARHGKGGGRGRGRVRGWCNSPTKVRRTKHDIDNDMISWSTTLSRGDGAA